MYCLSNLNKQLNRALGVVVVHFTVPKDNFVLIPTSATSMRVYDHVTIQMSPPYSDHATHMPSRRSVLSSHRSLL